MEKSMKGTACYSLGSCYKRNFEEGKVKEMMDWEYVPTDPGNMYMSESISRQHLLSHTPIILPVRNLQENTQGIL